jgi:hypothetical protein
MATIANRLRYQVRVKNLRELATRSNDIPRAFCITPDPRHHRLPASH